MMRPIEHIGVVAVLPSDQLVELTTVASDVAAIIVVDGRGVTSGPDLLARFGVAFDVPQDEGAPSWVALADSLWRALSLIDSNRVLVVLTNADELASRSMSDLISLVLLFTDLANQVATTDRGFARSLQLSLVLLGESPSFDDP